jgi:hypothetical protein
MPKRYICFINVNVFVTEYSQRAQLTSRNSDFVFFNFDIYPLHEVSNEKVLKIVIEIKKLTLINSSRSTTQYQMKSLTIWLALLMNWMPVVFAYRVSNSVNKPSTCVMSATTPPRTILNYRDNLAGSADMEQKIEAKYYLKKSSKSHKGVNLGLIQSIVMTQAASLITCIYFSMIALTYSGHDVNSIRWDGSTHYGLLFPTESMAWLLIFAQGILAAAPMIYIGNFIESSERRNMANVHFSTISKC